MSSKAYQKWATERVAQFDRLEEWHRLFLSRAGNPTTEPEIINNAYVMNLATQFQGFCRELHNECIECLTAFLVSQSSVAPLPPTLISIVKAQFTHGLKLDAGNANTGNIGPDFNRLGLEFWKKFKDREPDEVIQKQRLDDLNACRNAIAHDRWDSSDVLGRRIRSSDLTLPYIKDWRSRLESMARVFDELMSEHLEQVTGQKPW